MCCRARFHILDVQWALSLPDYQTTSPWSFHLLLFQVTSSCLLCYLQTSTSLPSPTQIHCQLMMILHPIHRKKKKIESVYEKNTHLSGLSPCNLLSFTVWRCFTEGNLLGGRQLAYGLWLIYFSFTAVYTEGPLHHPLGFPQPVTEHGVSTRNGSFFLYVQFL